MSKVFHFKNVLPKLIVALMSAVLFSCGGDEDEKLDDGSSNTTDVAVTSNLSKLGIRYAHIDGYVNLNLITSTYTSQQVGIELSLDEDFDSPGRAVSKELEGRKLTVVIDTLSGHTTYYYRTFVEINGFQYYGEKRSFTTKDFPNIAKVDDASELTLTSAKIKYNVDANSIDDENDLAVGVAYSTSKADLQLDEYEANRYISVWSGSIYSDFFYYSTGTFDVSEQLMHMHHIKGNKIIEATICPLKPGETYYYCSYTRAGRKFKFGDMKSFSTKELSDVQISTGDATDITIAGATIKSYSSILSLYPSYSPDVENVSIRERIKEVGVKYGLSQDNLSMTEKANEVENNEFITRLSRLHPEGNKTYFYCSYISVGGLTLTGNVKSFTTKSANSYLTTEDAVDITSTSAIVRGETTLSTLYGNASIEYYCEYYKEGQSKYRRGGRAQQNGNNLTYIFSHLDEDTKYYYHFYALINNRETVCSTEKSFTTIPQ